MGDNVIDDAQVIFEVAGYQGGGDTGKVIFESVTLTMSRDTRGYSGIGNEAETAVGYGTRTASIDHEQDLNQEAADMLKDLWNNDRSPKEISIIAEDTIDAHAAKFDWNELELDVQDDGDVTTSVSGKVRGLEFN